MGCRKQEEYLPILWYSHITYQKTMTPTNTRNGNKAREVC